MAARDMGKVRRRLETMFPGRCVNRFLAIQGLDRAMVIASQSFTALIPLLILVAAVLPTGSEDAVAHVIINRFQLSGASADAVTSVFAHSGSGSVSLLSLLLLLYSGVSLTRRLQWMYLDAWRLRRLPGVRGSLNAAWGLAALLVEISLLYLVGTLVRTLPFDWLLGLPLSAGASLVLWTSVPYLLLDRRIPWRRLLPGGALAGLSSSLYGVATTIYMPRLMETYSERYGLFGVTIALVSGALPSRSSWWPRPSSPRSSTAPPSGGRSGCGGGSTCPLRSFLPADQWGAFCYRGGVGRSYGGPSGSRGDVRGAGRERPARVERSTGGRAVTGPEQVELEATYFDTAGLDLVGAGITLRRRVGGEDEGWHVKLPTGTGRWEVHQPAGEDARCRRRSAACWTA